MTPDDVTNAIVNAIIIGGRQWVVSTIAAMLPSLWVITIILHLARPYVLRTVRKLSLRFGADVWDAGTEVDNITFGAAFIQGDNATDHVAENSVITPFLTDSNASSYLASLAALALIRRFVAPIQVGT